MMILTSLCLCLESPTLYISEDKTTIFKKEIVGHIVQSNIKKNVQHAKKQKENFEQIWLNKLQEKKSTHQQSFEEALTESQALTSPKKVGNSVFYFQNNIFNDNSPNRKNNLQRLLNGKNPVGPGGISLELHHINQKDDDTIICISQQFHQQNKKLLHNNTGGVNAKPSNINRVKFAIKKKKACKIVALSRINKIR